MRRVLVFADIDGTIIDDCYQPKAFEVIERLEHLNVPIILCSSKTRAEIEYYQNMFNLKHPFISENGGAIFIPKNYFPWGNLAKRINDYEVIELGVPYGEIRKRLEKIRKKVSFDIVGFGDLTAKQLAKETSLPFRLACLAKKREYSEPILSNKKYWKTIYKSAINQKLKTVISSKFISLVGQHDKGIAATILKNMYSSDGEALETFAIGNDVNDISLFKASNNPFSIQGSNSLVSVWVSLINSISSIR